MDSNSLSHTKWNCKYHIVFAPKYRRKDAEDTTADSTKSTDSDNSDSNADANKESSDKEDSDEEDVTYGEVKSVEDGKITIAVGTMKEMDGNGGAPGGEHGSDRG